MDPIAQTFGSNRIVHGVAIPYPLANPDPDPGIEYAARKKLVTEALDTLARTT